MSACHGLTQIGMSRRLNPLDPNRPKPAPLRKIVSDYVDENDRDCDVLECGHTVYAPTDRNGVATSASRRRCRFCATEVQR